MKYYIDFDNTLYETSKLTIRMLEAITEVVTKTTELEKDVVFENVKYNFNSTEGNIYTYAEKVANNYNVNGEDAVKAVKEVVKSGKDLVFPDAKRFLEKLKANGDTITLLTYIPDESNEQYQKDKIEGSGLEEYFDNIIITPKLKYKLDDKVDYKNGIFIDDSPRDLNGLYEKSPIEVIRIRKPGNKRSKVDMDNKDIKEYTSFDDIELEDKKKQGNVDFADSNVYFDER